MNHSFQILFWTKMDFLQGNLLSFNSFHTLNKHIAWKSTPYEFWHGIHSLKICFILLSFLLTPSFPAVRSLSWEAFLRVRNPRSYVFWPFMKQQRNMDIEWHYSKIELFSTTSSISAVGFSGHFEVFIFRLAKCQNFRTNSNKKIDSLSIF